MITGLKEIDPVFAHQVDDAMLLRQPTRPRARQRIFKRLWLANSTKWIIHNGFDELKGLQCHFAVGLNPKAQVFAEFFVEYSQARPLSHGSSSPRSPSIGRWIAISHCRAWLA